MRDLDLARLRREKEDADERRARERITYGEVQDSSDLAVGLVRVLLNNGRSSIIANGSRYRVGVWVFLERLPDDEWYVTGINVKRSVEKFGAGFEAALTTSIDGEVTGSVWGARNMKTGKVQPSPNAPGTLTVQVLKTHWLNGVLEVTEYDLTPHLPPTSGGIWWAKLGVHSLDGSIVVATGDEVFFPTADMLSLSSLASIRLAAGVIPLYGISLRNGQTDVSQSKFESAQPFVSGAPTYQDVHPMLTMEEATTLTITADAITITQSHHIIDTAGGADDLATINGAVSGGEQHLFVRIADVANPITLKHSTGNMLLAGAADLTLSSVSQYIHLIYDVDLSKWIQVGSSPSTSANTTNATPTTLASINTAADTAYTVEAIVTARRTGGAAGTVGDGASYKLIGSFKNVAGTLTQRGSTDKTSFEDQSGWDADFDVSGTTIRIRITGAIDNNITWKVVYTLCQT